MKIPKNKIYIAISVISLIALIFSVIIEIQKTQNNQSLNNVCSALGGPNQCESVQNSQYGRIFSIDNAYYGITGFSIMLLLSLLYLWKNSKFAMILIIIGSIIAGLLSLWLVYVQAFLLKLYCPFCMVVDLLSIVLLGTAIFIIVSLTIKKK